MKKFVLLVFVLMVSMITNAQSMLCTYNEGFFIKNGNAWYEYRLEKKDGVWATYIQYSTDNNYYYIKNSRCCISIPKQSTNNIWIKRNNSSSWQVLYTTIKTYNYCPVRGGNIWPNIFTFDRGFFVKEGNIWKLYLPEKQTNASWADYTQYRKDDNFYYIKNSSDEIAIPRKSNDNFFWYKNGKWETLYNTLAVYDGVNQSGASKKSNVNTEMSNANNNNVKQNQAQKYYDCYQCNGKGSSVCTNCNYAGQSWQYIRSWFPPYRYYWGYAKCNICGGNKTIKCGRCSGSGKLTYDNNNNNVNNYYQPQRREIKEEKPCTSCNGSGMTWDGTPPYHNAYNHRCVDINCQTCRKRHCERITKHIHCGFCQGKGYKIITRYEYE